MAVLSDGRGKDQLLLQGARTIWSVTAPLGININVEHLPGIENVVPDALSRYQSSDNARHLIDSLVACGDINDIQLPIEFLALDYDV